MNSVRKRFSSNLASSKLQPVSSPRIPSGAGDVNDLEGVSPELVPIVTLLSSQSHRRYHEGIFMLYYDLNGDGKPADREWNEVYGILTGNQLAYWGAANLAQFKENPDALLQTSAKPNYINFTDAVYNAMKSLPAAKQTLDNVIIVSTTLKNRYILQFKSHSDLTVWYAALRLSNFEYSSLQEAYTGALLSARGSRLSDIKTILAEKRFDHEDWVSIRYGSGMAWKRCYAVVEPSISKKKTFTAGRILLYENEQKKKKQLMAVIINCTSATAIYPSSHLLIDHSTMLKLDGYINFSTPSLSTKVSKSHLGDFKRTSIFLMPEQHSAVPGFDTLIRFLVPLFDSFGLYGRPKRLKANRTDMESLLFGLPTLPRVHYLELEDIKQMTNSKESLNWDLNEWTKNIRLLLKSKLDRGYEGCGSKRGNAAALGALNSPLSSPQIMSSPKFSRSGSLVEQRPQPNSSTSNLAKPPMSAAPRQANRGFDRNVNDLSIGIGNRSEPNIPIVVTSAGNNNGGGVYPSTPPANWLPALNLDEIYQNYSDIHTPDREALERLENEMSGLDVNKNIYPKNDNDLFSDDDEEDEVDDGEEKIDIRRMGTRIRERSETASPALRNGLTVPPHYDDRSGSYSSVISPLAQFSELQKAYAKVDRPPYELLSSDEDLNNSPPPPAPPAHDPKLLNVMKEKINDVPQGTMQPGSTTHNSIHSESGRVSEVSDSDNSFEKGEESLDVPSLPPPQNKPRFIASPNATQNRQFSPEPQQPGYPVSPLVKPLGENAKPNLPYPAGNPKIKSRDNIDTGEIATEIRGGQGYPPQQQQRAMDRQGSPAMQPRQVNPNVYPGNQPPPPSQGKQQGSGPGYGQVPQAHPHHSPHKRPPPPSQQQQYPPQQHQRPPQGQQQQQRPPQGMPPPQQQRPSQGIPPQQQQQFRGMPQYPPPQQQQYNRSQPPPQQRLQPPPQQRQQPPPQQRQQPPQQQQYGRPPPQQYPGPGYQQQEPPPQQHCPPPQQYPSQGSGVPRGMVPKSAAQTLTRVNPSDLRGQGSQQYQYYPQLLQQQQQQQLKGPSPPAQQQQQGLLANPYGQYNDGGAVRRY